MNWTIPIVVSVLYVWFVVSSRNNLLANGNRWGWWTAIRATTVAYTIYGVLLIVLIIASLALTP